MEFMTCTEFERMIYQAVAERAFMLLDERDETLSIRIANNIAKAMSGKG